MAPRKVIASWALAVAMIATSAPASAADPSGPDAVAAMLRMARDAERDGHPAAAVLLYRQAHEARPFASEPLVAWGLLANRLGEPEVALSLLTAAVAMDSGDRQARRGLADALVSLDRGAEAVAVYERLLAEDAGDGDAWRGKGEALDALGERQRSEAAYRRGLSLTSDAPDPGDVLTLSLQPSAAPGAANAPGTRVAAAEPIADAPSPDRPGSAVREP